MSRLDRRKEFYRPSPTETRRAMEVIAIEKAPPGSARPKSDGTVDRLPSKLSSHGEAHVPSHP
jgi:hypothetical protein